MTTPTPTIWPIEPHTIAKHEILKNYLQAWFPILGGTSGRIIYLDGFAGPGIYIDGEDGSPVIALKTAQEHILQSHFKAEMNFLFVERDNERAKILRKILHDSFPNLPSTIIYEVLDAEFAPTLSSVLDKLEKDGAKLAPTLAFIDPFGFSGLPMRLIGRMMAYEKCEVIITFMSGFVNRFLDEFREDTLDELFACSEWREINLIKDPDKRQKSLIDLYTKQLKLIGNAVYTRNFEMIGQHNQPIYNLIFGTKHWKGLKAMKEAMCRVDRRGTYTFSDLTDVKQAYLIDYSTEEHWLPVAGDIVFNHFKGKKASINEIEKYVITDTPYIFRKSILRNIEMRNPPGIVNVEGRKRKYTHPDGCIIQFSM